jgi:hypothetical protein
LSRKNFKRWDPEAVPKKQMEQKYLDHKRIMGNKAKLDLLTKIGMGDSAELYFDNEEPVVPEPSESISPEKPKMFKSDLYETGSNSKSK